MPTFDKETKQLVNAARTLGSAGRTVFLEDNTLLRLCALAATDLGKQDMVKDIAGSEDMSAGYYALPTDWFTRPPEREVGFVELFLGLKNSIPDFPTYFKDLCEIHKRRLKFQMILERQPISEMEQVVPRCLLEYELRPPEALASWLLWRKWLYDIDNRSAQETGYLFEPILASAIGGVPFSATKSPVKRKDEPSKGRQVDCLDGKLAYEFKMRVTIAASGQGRFREELDFAQDCLSSGFVPVLLVLDPAPSGRLGELKKEFIKCHGQVYIGDEAWQHITDKAGEAMGLFVEKYVRTPLETVDKAYASLQPIQLVSKNGAIEVQIGPEAFTIPRREAEAVDEAEESPEGE